MRIVGNPPSGGKQPSTPTIGTATDDGTGTGVSVAFTPSTYIGKGTITYTATSNPGLLTGTGSGSPITVSGLTTGTTYSFTVAGTTNYGVSSLSSAQSNFVTPVAPSSFESIATSSPTSGTSISFTSISSSYKHLQLRIIGFAATASDSALQLTFNNDTAGNYVRHRLKGNGTAASADGATAQQYVSLGDSTLGITTTNPYVYIVDIIDYASTSKYKTVKITSGSDRNGSGVINLNSGLWLSTSAVNRIDIGVVAAGDNFATGTKIALYGIKG